MDMIRWNDVGGWRGVFDLKSGLHDGPSLGSQVRRITDVLEVFYLPTETRVNAAEILRQSFQTKLRLTFEIAGAEAEIDEELSPATSMGVLKKMADLIMLFCAAIGSMAFGVLTAYGIFRIAFAMMRPRRTVVAVKVSAQLASE
jgi:hypothetical protein